VADILRPASLLLGAACLWAACVLLLAFAGLGSRVADSRTGVDPPAIPRVTLVATPSRLGPLIQYAAVGQRPLFNADRRPSLAPAAEGGSDELDVMLTSVMITPRLQLAIFTSNKDATTTRVKLGDVVEGSNWRLARLEPRLAVLEGPGGQRSLDLRVFDGQGGESPTALGTVAGAAARDPAARSGDGTLGNAGGSGQPAAPRPVAVPRPPVPVPSPPDASDDRASPPTQPIATPPQPTTQDAQIEAIRRRIEARRAQMRAEAGAAGSPER
jgi:general secretion pathway protein N